MKRVLIGLIVGLLIGFIITKYIIIGAVPNGYVCVTVKNESGHTIKSIFLKYRGGNIKSDNLYKNDNVNLFFRNGGENTFSLVVILDNDSTLKSQETYVEGGYKMTGIVFTDQIKIEYK